VDALGGGRELFIRVQISLLIGLTVITLLHIRHQKRRPYPVKLKEAQAVFSCCALLALSQLL
jgi:hypothetical protein